MAAGVVVVETGLPPNKPPPVGRFVFAEAPAPNTLPLPLVIEVEVVPVAGKTGVGPNKPPLVDAVVGRGPEAPKRDGVLPVDDVAGRPPGAGAPKRDWAEA